MLLRATFVLMVLGSCTAAYAQEHRGTGIKLETWGVRANQAIQAPVLSNYTEDWWNRPWGLRERISLTDLNTDLTDNTNPANLDLKQRLLSTPGNSFVDAGIGVQRIGFSRGSTRDGLSLSLGGRIGLGRYFTLYGKSAWMPGLIDSDGIDALSGLEFETGLMLNPLPNISIRAGYRRLKLDYTLTGEAGDHRAAEGIIIGTGIRW